MTNLQVTELHREIAALGASMAPPVRERTRELYTPLHPATPPQRIVRDLSYGPHERHRLDLHLPATPDGTSRAVLVYVHGGGFTGGDKSTPGQPFYDNIGRFAVDSGFIGATITYRYAPEFAYPSGAEDVAAAVAHIRAVVGSYGGDGTRIVLMGHSAGAAHVATCIATPAFRDAAGPLRAAILSSGIYDPSRMEGGASSAYYGDDPSVWERQASLPGVLDWEDPLLVISAEFDPPNFHRQAAMLLHAYTDRHGRLPRFLLGVGHNHYSSPGHYGSIDDALSSQVASFVREVTA